MTGFRNGDVRMVTLNGVELVVKFSRSNPLGATIRAELEATGEYVEAELSVSDANVMDGLTAAAMLRALAHELEIGAL